MTLEGLKNRKGVGRDRQILLSIKIELIYEYGGNRIVHVNNPPKRQNNYDFACIQGVTREIC